MGARLHLLFSSLLFTTNLAWAPWRAPWARLHAPSRPQRTTSYSSSSSAEDLREQALELRREAAAMEERLGSSPPPTSSSSSSPEPSPPLQQWFALENSCWQLTLKLEGFKEERQAINPVTVNVRVALLPPGGDGLANVQILEPSTKYVPKGFVWSVGRGLDDNSDDASMYLRFNVRGEGLSPVLPDGSLYVNARIARGGGADLGAAGVARGGMGSGERPSAEGEGALQLVDGLVTFKRPQKARFLFMVYDGLLAEFKVVGTAALRPIAPPSPPAA